MVDFNHLGARNPWDASYVLWFATLTLCTCRCRSIWKVRLPKQEQG